MTQCTRKRLVVEFGLGTDLQGVDYTKAAVRALRDALWHNSLTVAPALGYPRESMQVAIEVGVAEPEAVDSGALAAVLPYGQASVRVTKGGLDVIREGGQRHTVIANVAAVVSLDIDDPGADTRSSSVADQGSIRTPVSTDDHDARQAVSGTAASGESRMAGDRGVVDEPSLNESISTGQAPASGDGVMKPIILEVGTGNDLYGEDYTKAGCRAVQDALHHSSLILFRSLGIDHSSMQITLHLGVQRPAAVDVEQVAAQIPFGSIRVALQRGGLDVVDTEHGTTSVIATAGLQVSLPLPASRFVLSAR